MQTRRVRFVTAWCVVAAASFMAGMQPSRAARVAVLSDAYVTETAADFNAKVPGHTFSPVDVGISVPSLATLTANYDALLLFEDNTFVNAPEVGNVVAAFANTGRPVVLGTFYEQDRSDGSPAFTPHGWGALEAIDPNTSDGTGASYSPHSLDPASIVAHPLTAGVTTLTAARFAGGNQAKAGTTVVANWSQRNARGNANPAIAYRVTGAACVIHLSIAPHYPTLGIAGIDFGGDFYRAWSNAFDFGLAACQSGPTADPTTIPTLSSAALAMTALLLLACGGLAHRSKRR